ncbi:secreted membrane-associated protein [Cryptosporidium canis]|uniref:Secreted membrane-associated protein n=1 Tax=Cryptosporidium canis TaxID=195482 RepID=A0A9D5HXB9_9CRYT|nr:secreted membrane-associated protein [Cryptosporidium canis]
MTACLLCSVVFIAIVLLFPCLLVSSETPSEVPSHNCESLEVFEEDSGFAHAAFNVISLDLVLMELDYKIIQLDNVMTTNLWLDMHKMNKYKNIILAVVTSWSCEGRPNHEIHQNEIVKYFKSNYPGIKKGILENYEEGPESTETMTKKFLQSAERFECEDMRSTLTLLFLIFKNSHYYLSSSFLLYLLICSFRETSGKPFRQSFAQVLRNENDVTLKIMAIGGKSVVDMFRLIKQADNRYKGLPPSSHALFETIRNPLTTLGINIPAFGLRFCLSMMEIAANGKFSRDKLAMILFFGSRMESSTEVFLASDILSELLRVGISLEESISLFLNDGNIFQMILTKINSLYGLDIAHFKDLLHKCMEFKSKYAILNGLVTTTDYLRRSSQRSKNAMERPKVLMRSKYAFL